ERDSLFDACMMLGAAQQMRVPSADLKPLRAPVDRAVKQLSTVSDEELISIGGFFWDLHRVKLVYPAYQRHGSKIVDELFKRLDKKPRRVLSHLDDERIRAALLMCSA